MGLCAVSRWCEGCRNNGKAQLSSALDRISERITLAFQTLVPPRSNPGGQSSKNTNFRCISIGYGGESVSQPPLKDKVFSTFLDQKPPFELRPENGVSPPTKPVMRCCAIGGVGVCPPKAKAVRSNRVGYAILPPFGMKLRTLRGWSRGKPFPRRARLCQTSTTRLRRRYGRRHRIIPVRSGRQTGNVATLHRIN
jgi:hypothetical protein